MSRVAVLHGTVAGMSYVGGASIEEENSAIDSSFFEKLDADYAALGHIHGARCQQMGKTLLSYPGSARVWRQGESGLRTICVVDTSNALTMIPRTVEVAGEYREQRIVLSLDGRAPGLEKVAGEWNKNDWVRIVFTGMVDDENTVVGLGKETQDKYKERVRVLNVESEVIPVAGISLHPAAKRFLEGIEGLDAEKAIDARVLERARTLGLRAIARKMGVNV